MAGIIFIVIRVGVSSFLFEGFAVIFGETLKLWLLLIVIGLLVLEIILWNKKKKMIASIIPR